MELLVAYDISTNTLAGEARLRRVAEVCQAYGQRVQKSVFECPVNDVQAELLRRDLEREVDLRVDSVRVYRLREPRSKYLWILGRDVPHDLRGPLILLALCADGR